MKKEELAQKPTAAEAPKVDFIPAAGDYQLPDLRCSTTTSRHEDKIDKTAMLELAAKLTQTLENYGVKGDVVAIRPGPVVTMYEFAPAPGTASTRSSA